MTYGLSHQLKYFLLFSNSKSFLCVCVMTASFCRKSKFYLNLYFWIYHYLFLSDILIKLDEEKIPSMNNLLFAHRRLLVAKSRTSFLKRGAVYEYAMTLPGLFPVPTFRRLRCPNLSSYLSYSIPFQNLIGELFIPYRIMYVHDFLLLPFLCKA